MSTHVLDVSGTRGLNVTINDPARTAASVSAKGGDDVRVTVGGAREVRVTLPPGVRIQRRKYTSKSAVHEDGKLKRDQAGEIVYEERPSFAYYLVFAGSLQAFVRSSQVEPPAEGVYEPTPHTTLYVKRNGAELDYSESGEMSAELAVDDLDGWFERNLMEPEPTS